ncbi:MAG: hypothetical protein V4555_02065 [Acidobacteriota bacterium]
MRFSPALLATLFCAIAATCVAQSPTPQLSLTTASGQTTFHIGERIPLTLTFTGSAANHINTAGYDRSGRLAIDTYTVTPTTGWTDPLADYYAHSGVFDAGGLFGIDPLDKPFHITRDLNEWVRFDQPGDYTITALSSRVSTKPHPTWSDDGNLTLRSHPLMLHIIAATPEWQQSTLTRIQQALSAPHQPGRIGDPDALNDLRYLASPASIPLLASYIREDSDISNAWWTASFGLYGLPPSLHDNALTALNQLLDNPDFPITNAFLSALTDLQRPASEEQPTGPHWLDTLTAAQIVRFDSNWHLAVAALYRKQGKALALSVHSLLSWIPQHPSDQDRAILASALGSNFSALSRDHQIDSLENNWDTLRSPSMLPVLRALAQPEQLPYTEFTHELPAAALERWYDLDPDGALREILTQLASPTLTLSAEDLRFLPPKAFPQLESTWAATLTPDAGDTTQAIAASLLTRFGTGSATAHVATLLNKTVGTASCTPQATELAYLVRFDPDAAAPLLHRALTSRAKDQTACFHSLFTDVAVHASGPSLIHAAVGSLNDPDFEVATDAVKFLTQYADASARQPLLDRYLQWSSEWSSHASSLNQKGVTDESHSHELDRELGPLLANSLLANQGWLPDTELASAVRHHCLGPGCNHLPGPPSAPVYIDLHLYQHIEQILIAQFNTPNRDLFESKIAQYPEGTTFTFAWDAPTTYDGQQSQSFIRDILQRHHMTLAPTQPLPTQKD